MTCQAVVLVRKNLDKLLFKIISERLPLCYGKLGSRFYESVLPEKFSDKPESTFKIFSDNFRFHFILHFGQNRTIRTKVARAMRIHKPRFLKRLFVCNCPTSSRRK
jgi:hypothetical protein